ncbi:hypothetical protein BIW11_13660 [Tropilaelaps mercedesae]|uniref:RING-type domain-containing protein n=1 Tax=Tropilaelaps mercedesae TaxID=418985 RepID=A0A1V9X134_9ACAR|nr:hypothetical protein BIW11_13660 [Tropilaelaps mercedesae]
MLTEKLLQQHAADTERTAKVIHAIVEKVRCYTHASLVYDTAPNTEGACDSEPPSEIPNVDEKCPICLKDIHIGPSETVLSCSHLFHGSCLTKMRSTGHSVCPLCRTFASLTDFPPLGKANS